MSFKFFKVVIIFSLLALILVLPASIVQAASNNDTVEWDGAGHKPGSNICSDVNFPYRAPYPTDPPQAVTIRTRIYKGDLTSVDVWYTTNASASTVSHWTRLGASWEANWYGCGVLGDLDIYKAVIPAQSTQVWYKIALTDGIDTDWILSPGEGNGIVSDDDGGWTTASTTLTTLDPTAIQLIDLKVRGASTSTGVWTASLLGMAALFASVFIWKRRS